MVLAVDYGHLAADRPPTGTLAAHRHGHLVPPVPDGSCDLTAHVAWDSAASPRSCVAAVRPALGATGPRRGLMTQRAALQELGVDAARPGRGGRQCGVPAGSPAAGAAATLLDPGGLGGLDWLVQPVHPPRATGQADPAPARVEP